MNYQYQIVAFLDSEPAPGERIYAGGFGWLPQVALKRRFGWKTGNEKELVDWLHNVAANTTAFDINTGAETKHERMPVRVVPVELTTEISSFNKTLFDEVNVVSKHPEREGANYYPHITVEYGSKQVVDPNLFTNRTLTIGNFWLVRDDPDTGDSLLVRQFTLKESK